MITMSVTQLSSIKCQIIKQQLTSRRRFKICVTKLSCINYIIYSLSGNDQTITLMFGQAMIRKFDTHRSLIHFECWEVTCLKYDVEHVRLTKEFGHLILINFVQCQPVFNSEIRLFVQIKVFYF